MTDIPAHVTEKVVARATAKGVKVVTMPVHPSPASSVVTSDAVTHLGRRRDPTRPGHFLDEAPRTLVGSLMDLINANPKAAIEPMPAPQRRLPVSDRPIGADAFLSASAAASLESFITAVVDARIAQRAGNNDKGAQDRLIQARAEFATNFVKK